MQANVGRSGPTTEAVLQLAYENGADVIFLQEPGVWYNAETDLYVPKAHPAFAVFVPQPVATKRPRAITYVREDQLDRLRVTQRQDLLAKDTADVVSLQIRGLTGPHLHLVNVYNAPRGEKDQAEGVRTLTGSRWDEAHEAVLVGGDFNAHDANWATEEWNGRTNSAGRLLSRWMGAQGWVLGMEAGTPTRGSAALDLIFLSPALQRLGWLRDCRVRPDLASGSDHDVIWTELNVRRSATGLGDEAGRFSENRADVELMKAEFESLLPTFETLIASAAAAAEAGATTATDQLDAATEALNEAVHKAVTASTPRSSGKRGGYVWWNVDCAEAHAKFRAARQQQRCAPRSDRYQERLARTRGNFRKAVTKAKRAWARQKVEELEGNDIFGAMQWAKGRRRYRSPPLMDADGSVRVETEEKAQVLRTALLPPPVPADLPQIDLHLSHSTTIAEEPLTASEVESALFEQNPKKAAGPDEVSFLTLRRLWPVAKDSMVTLMATGLRLGWHPRLFRQATLVALKKGGTRDPAQPRSYRLISLLPCLGKVLEKVVARRLTYYAQKYGWVPPEQFGGMPGRSTDDAALTLVHDVEAGWAKRTQRTTSALAFDVKGAFDATHGQRLVHQLYRIGCPLHLVRWVEAFLTERRAAVRLDGETTEMSTLDTGIPQGSPVSPILFIIFVSPLLRLFGPQSPDPRLRSL
ncbi:hypothetical protein CF326_g9121, partial [Tilletia indica]